MDLRRACARYAIDNVDWASCVRQLNKDIKVANSFLSDELKVSALVPPSKSPGQHCFSDGCPVCTVMQVLLKPCKGVLLQVIPQ